MTMLRFEMTIELPYFVKFGRRLKQSTNTKEVVMEITTHGFIVLLPQSKTTVNDVCQYVASFSANAHGQYFIAIADCDRSPDYWIGVILKPKNMKAFCKMKGTEEHYKVEPQVLDIDEQFLDFNHFLIHKKTGRGFYQTYHNSVNISTLMCVLKNAHANLEHNTKFDLDPDKTHDFSEFKQNVLTYQIYVNSEDLPAFLHDMERIKEVEIAYTTDAIDRYSKHEGLKGDIRDETRIIKFFSKQTDRLSLIKSILSFEETNHPFFKKFVIRGVDPHKNHRTFNITQPKDYTKFDRLDYHTLVKQLRYDSDNLSSEMQNSVAIDALIRVANSDNGREFANKNFKTKT